MAARAEVCYRVRFCEQERTLTRKQLERAPSSLLATIFLKDGAADGTKLLDIRGPSALQDPVQEPGLDSDEDSGRGSSEMPSFTAWMENTVQIFHVSGNIANLKKFNHYS